VRCDASLMQDPNRPIVQKGSYHMLTARQCQTMLKPLAKMVDATIFARPVDPIRLGIPDYPKIVKHPMDLGTIEAKLRSADDSYTADDFVENMRLVWYNAKIYNPPGTPVAAAAERMSRAFEEKLEGLITSGVSAPVHRSDSGSAAADVSGGMPLKIAKSIVKSLQQNQTSVAFRVPVDAVKLGIPNYPLIIMRPMDLQTVTKKLEAGSYATVGDLRSDLDLIWDNAVIFNTEASVVGGQAVGLRGFTAKKFAQEGFPSGAPIVMPAAQGG